MTKPNPKRIRNRLTIEMTDDLRDRILAYRADPAWEELSLGGKVRALLETALRPPKIYGNVTVADLVNTHWFDIVAASIELSLRRLHEIRAGDRPEDEELVQLETVLPQDIHELMQIRCSTFGGQTHGAGKSTERV